MISDPCCTNCGACNELCAVGKIPHALTSGKFAANSFTGEQDLRTEFASLLPRSFGEFGSADAGWKP
jgi:ferredoxin